MTKSKDAKNSKEYDLEIYTKGFVASSKEENNSTEEFFQYKQIYNILLHPDIGVEIIFYNGKRRIFYNQNKDLQDLFNTLTDKMQRWMKSNRN